MTAGQLAGTRARVEPHRADTVLLGGLPIAVTDRASAARAMVEEALARRGSGRPPAYITSANGQVLSVCALDPEVRGLFCAADVIHADGMPLVIASRRLCRVPLPERVATTDLFHDVAREAIRAGASVYLLGATQGVVEAAVAAVRRLHPALRIVGWRHGYIEPGQEDEVIATLNAARPDIVFVSMGAPREQAFVVRNRDRLTGVGVVKTSGGLFDFLAGARSRAPAWMQDAGLEWLYRMLLEPRRLFRRYALTNPHAIYLLLTRSG